jgi:hypothetical protein
MPLIWGKLAREKSAGGFRRPLHFMDVKEMRDMGRPLRCSRED